MHIRIHISKYIYIHIYIWPIKGIMSGDVDKLGLYDS